MIIFQFLLFLLYFIFIMSSKSNNNNNNNNNLVNKIQESLLSHKRGNFQVALLLYEEIIPLINGKVATQICNNAGAIYLQQGDIENAILKFQQGINFTPENAESHFNLAVTYNSKVNKQVLAIKHCRLAIKYDPIMHKAYHLMGNILQDLGKPEEAVKYFTEAERIANEQNNLNLNNGELIQEQKKSPSSPSSSSSLPSSVNTLQQFWFWNAQINHTYRFIKDGNSWNRIDITNISSTTTSLIESKTQSELELENSNFNILEIKCISERPLIFEIPYILSNEECNQIMTRAEPLLKSSHVMGQSLNTYSSTITESGSTETESTETTIEMSSSEPYRKSSNAWLSRDEILSQLQYRVSVLTEIPYSYIQIMSEDLQVIKYEQNEQFQLHHDSSQFHPRLLTALVYLSDGSIEGGETWFPFAPGNNNNNNNEELESIDIAMNSLQDVLTQERINPSQKPSKGLLFSPKRGKAVLFFNHLPDSRIDVAALHSGRKIVSGLKWAANYWIKLDTLRLEQITSG